MHAHALREAVRVTFDAEGCVFAHRPRRVLGWMPHPGSSSNRSAASPTPGREHYECASLSTARRQTAST